MPHTCLGLVFLVPLSSRALVITLPIHCHLLARNSRITRVVPQDLSDLMHWQWQRWADAAPSNRHMDKVLDKVRSKQLL